MFKLMITAALFFGFTFPSISEAGFPRALRGHFTGGGIIQNMDGTKIKYKIEMITTKDMFILRLDDQTQVNAELAEGQNGFFHFAGPGYAGDVHCPTFRICTFSVRTPGYVHTRTISMTAGKMLSTGGRINTAGILEASVVEHLRRKLR